MLSFKTTSLAVLLFLIGCDSPSPGDAGIDAGPGDAGQARDAGEERDAGEALDAQTTPDAGEDPPDAGEDPPDAGADGGEAPTDAGGAGCPCFGATEIAAIEAHAAAGGSRGCMTGVVSGNVTTGALSSSDGPMNLQVDVLAIIGFAGTDYSCGDGCSDTNDDTTDDCAGAPLPGYSREEAISEEQHDACEALIADACE